MKTLPFLPHTFEEIASHLKEGLPIIMPTETCYGFSGDVFSLSALLAVEKIKQRNNKPFLLLAENLDQLSLFGKIGNNEKKIETLSAEKPTTFLFPKTGNIPSFYFPDFSEIGIRIPHYQPLIGFLHFYENPLFSTSANVSGFPELYTSQEIISRFGHVSNLLFVDAGDLQRNPPSRLVRLQDSGAVEILRK